MMTDSANQLNAIHPEDVLLINHVVTAVQHPQHLVILDALLSQAESAGWLALVKAIRGILGGVRELEKLGGLDVEELRIVSAILKKLEDAASVSKIADTTCSQEPSPRSGVDGENYLKSVREQYESYPYPRRNPDDEKKSLFVTTTEHLGKISHYCYKGMRDLRKGGRFLVAGGGTGDAAIYLAEQLRDSNGEVVYLDLSSRSMEIARQRAAVRGLTNISWYQRSLLDVPSLNLGYFDYINCCGVLHHLPDPVAGLRALSGALKPDGCMAIMVYAQYGRTAIYQIQELMRRINGGEQDLQKCISNAHLVLRGLPEGNWYKRDEYRWHETIKDFGDIEIFDLFLHSQDRAYTVPEVYGFAASGNLNFAGFTGFTGQKLVYDFLRYFSDPDIVERVGNMTLDQQQAIAELTNGCIKTHTFYLAKSSNTLADTDNHDLIPYYTFKFVSSEAFYNDLSRNPGKPISINFGGGVEPFSMPQSQYTRFILRYIDGENTVRKILEYSRNDASSFNMNPSDEELLNEIKKVFNCFFNYELMYMRHNLITPYKCDYQLGS